MKKEQIITRLAEIKTEQDFHSNALSGLAHQKQQLCRQLYTLENGLSTGDKVKFMDGKVEKTGVITGWQTRWNNETLPIVTIHKSNGKLGLRKTNVWHRYKFEKI